MTYDVAYYSAHGAPTLRVFAVAFPWMGESAGGGFAPWRLARLRMPASDNWPYIEEGWPILGGAGADGLGASLPRRALGWFPLASDGTSEVFPLLASIVGCGITRFSHEQWGELRAEVERVPEHLVGIDRATFAAVLFLLDAALADGTGEVEFSGS